MIPLSSLIFYLAIVFVLGFIAGGIVDQLVSDLRDQP